LRSTSFATTSRPIRSHWSPPFRWGRLSETRTRQAGLPSSQWS
jgi:hypothetical protein